MRSTNHRMLRSWTGIAAQLAVVAMISCATTGCAMMKRDRLAGGGGASASYTGPTVPYDRTQNAQVGYQQPAARDESFGSKFMPTKRYADSKSVLGKSSCFS